MKIQVKKLTPTAELPTRGSEEAAGYDLHADETVAVMPHTCAKVSTGLSFALPKNTFAALFPRSGLATKQGLRLANCVGVCDSDYRGPYIVAIYNDSDKVQVINSGDRIAQMILLPYVPMEFEEVKELDETARGASGFGSTGR